MSSQSLEAGIRQAGLNLCLLPLARVPAPSPPANTEEILAPECGCMWVTLSLGGLRASGRGLVEGTLKGRRELGTGHRQAALSPLKVGASSILQAIEGAWDGLFAGRLGARHPFSWNRGSLGAAPFPPVAWFLGKWSWGDKISMRFGCGLRK